MSTTAIHLPAEFVACNKAATRRRLRRAARSLNVVPQPYREEVIPEGRALVQAVAVQVCESWSATTWSSSTWMRGVLREGAGSHPSIQHRHMDAGRHVEKARDDQTAHKLRAPNDKPSPLLNIHT